MPNLQGADTVFLHLLFISDRYSAVTAIFIYEAVGYDAERIRQMEQRYKNAAMNELVKRLSEGKHTVEASLLPERTAAALKERIDSGYVHIKFTGTKGGTNLGISLDRDASNLKEANFVHQKGTVHLVGSLTLNYVNVRCLADIDLRTLEGQGYLEPFEAE